MNEHPSPSMVQSSDDIASWFAAVLESFHLDDAFRLRTSVTNMESSFSDAIQQFEETTSPSALKTSHLRTALQAAQAILNRPHMAAASLAEANPLHHVEESSPEPIIHALQRFCRAAMQPAVGAMHALEGNLAAARMAYDIAEEDYTAACRLLESAYGDLSTTAPIMSTLNAKNYLPKEAWPALRSLEIGLQGWLRGFEMPANAQDLGDSPVAVAGQILAHWVTSVNADYASDGRLFAPGARLAFDDPGNYWSVVVKCLPDLAPQLNEQWQQQILSSLGELWHDLQTRMDENELNQCLHQIYERGRDYCDVQVKAGYHIGADSDVSPDIGRARLRRLLDTLALLSLDAVARDDQAEAWRTLGGPAYVSALRQMREKFEAEAPAFVLWHGWVSSDAPWGGFGENPIDIAQSAQIHSDYAEDWERTAVGRAQVLNFDAELLSSLLAPHFPVAPDFSTTQRRLGRLLNTLSHLTDEQGAAEIAVEVEADVFIELFKYTPDFTKALGFTHERAPISHPDAGARGRIGKCPVALFQGSLQLQNPTRFVRVQFVHVMSEHWQDLKAIRDKTYATQVLGEAANALEAKADLPRLNWAYIHDDLPIRQALTAARQCRPLIISDFADPTPGFGLLAIEAAQSAQDDPCLHPQEALVSLERVGGHIPHSVEIACSCCGARRLAMVDVFDNADKTIRDIAQIKGPTSISAEVMYARKRASLCLQGLDVPAQDSWRTYVDQNKRRSVDQVKQAIHEQRLEETRQERERQQRLASLEELGAAYEEFTL